MMLVSTLAGRRNKRAADDDARVIVGDVGELQAAGDVADGEHAPVGRLQAGVDLDPACAS